ncbi:helix-turn-helix domain-containing protein [Bilophila wadsworthia]|uniref:helix-turn-helix domain-containing protein n=1 Tax=Bilophila wadsworthia TaxID=35833 RepID=UPI002670B4CD|nr:helix-turn-helix domain-containing protein [Bilophila wadsworthia]
MSSDARLQSVAESIIGASTVRKGLSDWARYIGMSRRSLARLVVKETGLSFGRWRQQLLLVIAIQKLSDGVSVQQTAWDLGYESVTAFITMFKKALGTSPGKYAMEDAAGK